MTESPAQTASPIRCVGALPQSRAHAPFHSLPSTATSGDALQLRPKKQPMEAKVPRPEPRTALEQLIRQSRKTYRELIEDFHTLAATHAIQASITERHLRRLASGERTGTTPPTARVLQAMFGAPVEELLSPAVVTRTDWLATRTVVVSPNDELLKATEDSARFLARASLMSAPAIARIRSGVDNIEANRGQVGKAAQASMLTSLRREVLHLLDRYPSSRHTRELYRLGSRLSLMLAQLHDGPGPDYSVDLHYETACRFAELAGEKAPALAPAAKELVAR